MREREREKERQMDAWIVSSKTEEYSPLISKISKPYMIVLLLF